MSTRQERSSLAEEYSLLAQLAEEMQKEITLAQNLLVEIDSTVITLKNISSLGESREVLIPISSGVYAKAVINRQDKFLVAIGSNILVEKDLNDTLEFLRQKREELQQLIDKRVNDLNKILQRLQQLQAALR
ncbi:prefoldin subunit alpha [Infirmifilum lucidum]|uniref:Prefoldin subunit alpha n=1 Tax=Infirmifilum lucidum TaxID=2776706 RepID=A0A7L9FEW4_9CREN|nr:prefoldin subunit alpha [Infirmifilum lucidum]QOJ78227.1 prefoldin subunit alpha [Infirmifilum lucidum]